MNFMENALYKCIIIIIIIIIIIPIFTHNICDPASQNQEKVAWPSFVLWLEIFDQGSAWVIFQFLYILKEQSFFYIIPKFGSIKRIISRVLCNFSRPIFLRSDGSCDHNTCPIIFL